ncbi:hypothetical protein AAON49_07855 [Pseudotenacibaculum sp. MALMAid0570]|uniref:hypothetical protein n=1 Tax=Pseudotenacibaculum sp. MALMAid0570 TaxID=3143938 RepID=UPI0032DF4665
MKRTFLLLLLQVTIFTSCMDVLNTPEKNVKFQDVVIENRYGIKLPSYMKVTTELNDEASLQYMNALKETYCVIIDEPSKDFVDVFKDSGEYIDSLSVAKNYQMIQMSSFKEVIVDFKTSSPRNFRNKKLISVIQEASGIVEGHKIAYSFSFIQGKENIYMVICWTLYDRKKRYQDTFQSVLKSFYELK